MELKGYEHTNKEYIALIDGHFRRTNELRPTVCGMECLYKLIIQEVDQPCEDYFCGHPDIEDIMAEYEEEKENCEVVDGDWLCPE